MARHTKQTCGLPDPSKYNKRITILRAPDELEEQEAETRPWRDWRTKGAAYAAVHTSGSRQVSVASQVHQYVDAVFETPWTQVSKAVRSSDAVKLIQGDDITYWHVVAAENVDMNNVEMRLICRTTTPSGLSE